MKRTLPRRTAALVAAAPLVLMLGACGHANAHRSITSTLVSGATGYFPVNIIANKEDTLFLNVGNGTEKVHGFTIEGYQVAKTVDPNQTLKVKLHLGRAGTFKIFCQLHPAHQTATLIVR